MIHIVKRDTVYHVIRYDVNKFNGVFSNETFIEFYNHQENARTEAVRLNGFKNNPPPDTETSQSMPK